MTIEILHEKIEYISEVVKTSNVVMNNLFEFYFPKCTRKISRFLKGNLKKETIVVVHPNIGTMLTDLQIGVIINN